MKINWLFKYVFTIVAICLLGGPAIGGENVKEIKDFKSDGCSLFPDRSVISEVDWCLCCFEHDITYWQGGTAAERLKADEALRECIIKKTGDEKLANVMYAGVRVGGSPYFYNWYRWGYGWDYDRKYGKLSEAEKRQIAHKLNSYFANSREAVCPEPQKPASVTNKR